MITVHHLENSRSQRVLWLLEELGLDYRVEPYKRDPKTLLAPPSLRAVHPLGKSPVLVDDAGTFAESGAIIEYVLQRYDERGSLAPAIGTPDRQRFTYWLHYADGSAMPPLLLSLVFSRLKQAPMPFFVRPIARAIADKAMAGFVGPQLKTHFDFIESELADRPWFAGAKFSASDIQMSFPIEAAAARGALGDRPRLRAWLETIQQRPAYQRAIERGGRFELLR
jgi:glutathione S-transferase